MISTLLQPGVVMMLIGLLGMLLRRSVLSVLLSFNVSMLGIVLLLVGSQVGNARGQVAAFVLCCVTLLMSIAGGAMSVAIYRRKAGLNLDEQRELRG